MKERRLLREGELPAGIRSLDIRAESEGPIARTVKLTQTHLFHSTSIRPYQVPNAPAAAPVFHRRLWEALSQRISSLYGIQRLQSKMQGMIRKPVQRHGREWEVASPKTENSPQLLKEGKPCLKTANSLHYSTSMHALPGLGRLLSLHSFAELCGEQLKEGCNTRHERSLH